MGNSSIFKILGQFVLNIKKNRTRLIKLVQKLSSNNNKYLIKR